MEYNGNLLITGDFEPSGSNWIVSSNVELISNNIAVGIGGTTSGHIYGAAEFNNTLYICGPDDKLKYLSGSTWEDQSYNNQYWADEIWDVIVYNNELYIMGDFANSISLKKMNASGEWNDISEVGQIGSMTLYGGMKVIDNELYLFDQGLNVNSGGLSGILKYNGTSWDDLGNFSYEVHDVEKYNGQLYIASNYGLFKAE
jgi:hypothetical protein